MRYRSGAGSTAATIILPQLEPEALCRVARVAIDASDDPVLARALDMELMIYLAEPDATVADMVRWHEVGASEHVFRARTRRFWDDLEDVARDWPGAEAKADAAGLDVRDWPIGRAIEWAQGQESEP